MEPTKTISLRIEREFYDKILVECEIKGITITEWMERQIAVAKNVRLVKAEIVLKLERIYDHAVDRPTFSQILLSKLINYIEGKL